jgi:hypothetical protein
MENMFILQFVSDCHHPHTNTTVRLGRKWYDRLTPGTTIGLNSADICARVLRIELTTLGKISPRVLKYEHDPDCRTISGLRRVLAKYYDNITDTSPVTVVTYTPIGTKDE